MSEMKILDCFNIEKGKTAVFGAKENSPFIKILLEELKEKGTTALIYEMSAQSDADYTFYLADQKSQKPLSVHTDIPEDMVKIGVITADVFEKKVADSVENIEKFCEIADTNENQLIYPVLLSKFIKESEKFDFMFIDSVSSADKKYFARELAKYLSMPVCIGVAESGDIELLRKNK